jgi:hypothetical protein
MSSSPTKQFQRRWRIHHTFCIQCCHVWRIDRVQLARQQQSYSSEPICADGWKSLPRTCENGSLWFILNYQGWTAHHVSVTEEIRFHDINNVRASWQIYMNLGMNIMPLHANITVYLLISFHQQYQHCFHASSWGGSNTRGNCQSTVVGF